MRTITQVELENMRRCLLQILQESGAAVHATSVRNVLDALDHPTTWERFVATLEYLAGEELIRVFPAGTETELSDVAQAKYLMIIRQASYDSKEAQQVRLRIRQRGRRFLEGNEDGVKGVAHV